MTLQLGAEDIRALATHELTMAAAHAAVTAERDGLTVSPPRLDVDRPHGFLRVMPAAVGSVMGLKVMTLAHGIGNRYMILLYSQVDGSLIAVLDAAEVTRMRTAATTAVAGRLLAPAGVSRMGLIGSGFEAQGHLRAMAQTWPLEEVLVYSPSSDRRERFATRMSEELGLDVRAVSTTREAIGTMPVSVLATKATNPVVDGTAFPSGAVVLSIGSTRPDLRELDRATLQRASLLLVDDARQVVGESGDIMDALSCGALLEEHIVSMAAHMSAANGDRPGAAAPERDLLVFKSVGTAIQDLALAQAVVEAAQRTGRGRDIGELTSLKAFSSPDSPALPALPVLPEATA